MKVRIIELNCINQITYSYFCVKFFQDFTL